MKGNSPSLRPLADDDGTPPADIARLYRSEAPKLLRLFGQRLGQREAADLVQESFLRLVRRSQAPEPIASPSGYLKRIALNLIRNPGEIAARRQQEQLSEFDDACHAGHDPVAGLEARDLLERLNLCVAKLKPKTRTIFLAHRVEGLSYAQIAERTGLSVKGVEKQMSKALVELDRMIHR
jgi:RNA polymerase sigma-70 factor (ECF subfamily)